MPRIRSRIVLTLGTLLLTSGLGAGEMPLRLENGIRVSVLGSAPAAELPDGRVAVGLFIAIGEEHDPEGRSGLAHLCEHLFVTAAAGETPSRSVDTWMRARGMQANAQTGRIGTFVLVLVERDRLDAELADLAIRLTDLRVTAEDLARELPRLDLELHNMFAGHPYLAAPNHAQAAIDPLPAGGRKGGRIEHLRAVTAEEAMERFRTHYTPDRMHIVIAGAIDPAIAEQKVRAHFGKIAAREGAALAAAAPPSPEPGRTIPLSPPPELADHLTPPRTIVRGWRTPPAGTADSAALHAIGARLLSQQPSMPGGARPDFVPIFAPIDNPTFFGASVTIGADETAPEALARLDARMRDAAQFTSASAVRTTLRQLRGFLDLEAPDPFMLVGNPYLVALARGKRVEMGLDAAAWRARLDACTPEQIAAFAAEHLIPARAVTVVCGVDPPEEEDED